MLSSRQTLRLMLILGLTQAAAPSVQAQEPMQPATAGSIQDPRKSSLYYYNGDHRVDVRLSHSELRIKAVDGVDAVAARARGAASDVLGVANARRSKNYLEVATRPMEDREALDALASRLAGDGIEVQAVLYPEGVTTNDEARRLSMGRELTVRVRDGVSIEELATRHQAEVVRAIDWLPGAFVLRAKGTGILAGLEAANAIYEQERDRVEFSTPLVVRARELRLVPNDPLFPNQWHLRNTGQVTQAVAGSDVNVVAAWDQVTGSGVNIGIVDDSLEPGHPDLAPNARPDIDIDLIDGDDDPSPGPFDGHGVACAGIAAAKGNNGIGVAGAALDAGLVGIRLSGSVGDDLGEATAFLHYFNDANAANTISIYSNSWGPSDDGRTLETFGPLVGAAFERATREGRNGRGSIYVWAAGNGRCSLDNVNKDGYASSRFTIAVGACGANDRFSYYSEPGASLLITAPSNYGSCPFTSVAGTTTTDITGSEGYSSGDYTSGFGGTSSACPLAAGVIALILEKNPNLGWRDVQWILAKTAARMDPTNADWRQNGAGLWFNHNYGFGRVNALEAVNLAGTWTNVPANATPLSTTDTSGNLSIPDNSTVGLTRTFRVDGPDGFVVEHAEVVLNITHARRGHVTVSLISPSGFESRLLERSNDTGGNFSNWMLTSRAHLGESPDGDWRLVVRDVTSGTTGTYRGATLRLHGFVSDDAAVPTPTATPQPTATPSASATASPSPSQSPTPAASATPTASPSPSATPSPTASATPTATPAPTRTPAAAITLSNAVPAAGNAGPGTWTHYAFDVPEGSTSLRIELAPNGPAADADLYVRRAGTPTFAAWDYRPYLPGTRESVTITGSSTPAPLAAGRWFISVYGYQGASAFSLVATATGGATPTPTPTPSPTASPTPTATPLPPELSDAFEPDNALAQARPIAVNGSAQQRDILPATDQDWATFTLTQRTNIQIETNGPSGGDTILELVNAAGRAIVSDDDAGTGLYSRIRRSLPAGAYYVRVRSYRSASTIAGYTLTVSTF